MMLLALLLALAGFALLGLSTDAHHQQRLGRRPDAARRRALRTAAWAALAASFLPAVAARGWIFGPVLWSGLVMLAAGVVFLLLNLVPSPTQRP